MMKNSRQLDPEVGMGATELMFVDRLACTIVEVKNYKTIVVQRDISTRTDDNGMSDSQSYEYSPNPDAEKITVNLRKNGRWVKQGESQKTGTAFLIGHRCHYHDYSF